MKNLNKPFTKQIKQVIKNENMNNKFTIIGKL